MTPEIRTCLLELDYAVQSYLHHYRSEAGFNSFANLNPELVTAADWGARLTYVLRSILDTDTEERRNLGRPQLTLTPHVPPSADAWMAADIRRRFAHAHRLSRQSQHAADTMLNPFERPSEPPPVLAVGDRERMQP